MVPLRGILADPTPTMLRRTPEFRIAVIGGIMIAGILLLSGRLWYVQVAHGDE